MKTKNYILAFIFIFTVTLIISDVLNNGASSHTSGAPATRTGSPGDGGLTCTSCHAGAAPVVQAGWITSNIPATGYVPGTTYTITATATGTGHVKFGFEISPQNLTGTLRGTLVNTNSDTHIISTKYITHTTAGTSGTGSKTWTFNWTAPVAGTGSFTFYGAFLVTNNSSSSSGDITYTSTLPVSECGPPSQPAVISGNAIVCQNASETYSISPVAGATSYTWTIPSGWSGTSATNSINTTTGSSGTISVVANGDCGSSTSRTLPVTTDQLSVSFSHLNVSCYNGNNGSATAIPANGIPLYSYHWLPSGDTTATVLNLSPGNHNVTVTDMTGCNASGSVNISQPDSISLSITHTNLLCNGASTAMATVTAGGGTPGYSYFWSSGVTSSTALNLGAGTVTVIVTDSNGCTKTKNTLITQPSPITSLTSRSDVTCNAGTNGTATVIASGGTPGYTYAWSPSGGNASIASGLSAGNYFVTISDTNNCIHTDIVSISEPDPITIQTSSTNANCGQTNGTVSAEASGGTPGYLYSWNTVPVQDSATAINLPAGSYSVNITDTNGCTANFIAAINDNSTLSVTVDTITKVNCFGDNNGSATISVTGGTPSYSYTWFPSGGDSTTASNLAGGSYSVTVVDSSGCISTALVDIPEPALLVADAGTDITICNGETIMIGASPVVDGGTGPFTYSWSPATGLDSSDISNPMANPSSTETYTVNITDSNGCTASSDIQVTVNELPQIPGIIQNDDTLFSTTANTYQWFLNGDTIPGATSGFYIPVQSGNYTVAVDSIGCNSVSAVYIISGVTEHVAPGSKIEIYPNPYHDKANIVYTLSASCDVLIEVYSMTGVKISTLVNQVQGSGTYHITFSAGEKNYSPGAYVLRMRAGNTTLKEFLIEGL